MFCGMSRRTSRLSAAARRGFTMIELLVVIAIIVLVSSIIFVAGGGGEGAALSSSERIVAGIAQGARGQAILKNAKTRLIIYEGSGAQRDYDKYRRFFGIIYADPESADPNNPDWIAATQGTYLPEGIYFDPSVSMSGLPTMSLEYPRSVAKAEGSGDAFYYYEFNSNGTVSTTPTDFQNKRLILRAMTLRPQGADSYSLEVDEGQEYIATGLIFRRVGTTTVIDDPEAAISGDQ